MDINAFKDHLYGHAPEAQGIDVISLIEHASESGMMHIKQIELNVAGRAQFNIALFLPAKNKPAPIFLYLNKYGNHTVHTDTKLRISDGWTDTGKVMPRGCHADRFCIDYLIENGYGVATLHESDISPDRKDGVFGVRAMFDETWGLISAWSWGLMRCVDYLMIDKDINHDRIFVTGHSRRGKAALWAGAQDARISMVCPHQSGTGGAAPSRKTNPDAETVRQINDQFPHWFCEKFKSYNDNEGALPFEQNDLLSLCAPRPLLVLNAKGDIWSDPSGTLDMVEKSRNQANYGDRISYFIRDGGHGWDPKDWYEMIRFSKLWFH
jgi:hypothetical protein